MTPTEARALALTLPASEELPHFEIASFRVGGKIFATLTPDGAELRVFVDPDRAEEIVAQHPECARVLHWGQRIAGVAFAVHDTSDTIAAVSLREAWRKRAPKRLWTPEERAR